MVHRGKRRARGTEIDTEIPGTGTRTAAYCVLGAPPSGAGVFPIVFGLVSYQIRKIHARYMHYTCTIHVHEIRIRF